MGLISKIKGAVQNKADELRAEHRINQATAKARQEQREERQQKLRSIEREAYEKEEEEVVHKRGKQKAQRTGGTQGVTGMGFGSTEWMLGTGFGGRKSHKNKGKTDQPRKVTKTVIVKQYGSEEKKKKQKDPFQTLYDF
jgi:hypothetical protein